MEIVFTDLDGTLLNNQKKVSGKDLDCLRFLGHKKVIRVLATGRTLFSLKRVLDPGFPVDFYMFSSGAGIIDAKSGNLIFSKNLSSFDIKNITDILVQKNFSFMVHTKVPDNHSFVYWKAVNCNPDFERRLNLYSKHATPYYKVLEYPQESAQIIVIFKNSEHKYKELCRLLKDYSVIRTTSPLDHKSMWVEIFPKSVSKGRGAKWLCDHLCIDISSSISIGNDYNDISLLNMTDRSYLVANGPYELKSLYTLTRSCEDNGFSEAVKRDIISRKCPNFP